MSLHITSKNKDDFNRMMQSYTMDIIQLLSVKLGFNTDEAFASSLDELAKIDFNTDIKVTTDKTNMTSQSNGLSKRLSEMTKEGRRLNDDSSCSERTLTEAMREITPYIEEKCKSIGASLEIKSSISLFACQEYFHKSGGPSPNIENKSVSMRPDGGIFMATLKNGNIIPLLIVEDKVQGTNDKLHEQQKKRQATGNAIERGAKNIRGAEMLFSGKSIFPYVIFASGCDFHSSETIAKRIEMMNMGIPNHYVGLTPSTTQEEINEKISTILKSIDIKKKCGTGIASVFVKAHKFDEMKHGSSLWKKDEIVIICKNIVDKVFESDLLSS